MSNKCPRCNFENREGAKFCSSCRSPMTGGSAAPSSAQPSSAQPAAAGQQQRPQPMQAQPQTMGLTCKCGVVNREGARFCTGCRSPLSGVASAPVAAADFVGLEAVKSNLKRIMQIFQREITEKKNPKAIKKIFIFQGKTGTGKSYVADSFTAMLSQSGYLQSSAIQTKWARRIMESLTAKGLPANDTSVIEYFNQQKPGAIIIDKAVEDPAFLHELILGFSQSEHNFISILLGLKEDFDNFFAKNVEDVQYIDDYFNFPEQSDDELAMILKKKLVEENFTINPDAEAILKDYIIEERVKPEAKHKNGHLVDKICLAAILKQKFANWEHNGSKPEEEKNITVDDIPLKNKPKTVDEILADLDAMVGMTEVKQTVREIAEKTQASKKRAMKQGKNYKGESNHIVITGNPGTGKTTIIRELALLFKAAGVLASDDPLEIRGTDLKAEYIGKTAAKVNDYCERAEGRILFIDEAYALVDDNGPLDQYAKDAIDTLIAHLENARDKFICVIAGYPREMETFIKKSNTGTESRFKHYINIPDYTADELIEIFERFNVEKEGFSLTEEARKKAREVIRDMVISKDERFGNARTIRNFFEKITSKIPIRLKKQNVSEEEYEQMESIIEAEDIVWDIKEAVHIDDILADLDKMVGMTDVKKMVRELAQTLQMQQERIKLEKEEAAARGEEYKPKAAAKELNNIVITGNPGTGKTTIVRSLAKLFQSIGLLPRDTIIECRGNDLTSGFQGQTSGKVDSLCEKALGGVLFIDEAYTLVNEQGPVDSYANEAIVTLLAHMENDGHRFITVAAGYQKEMELFIDKSNPGMKRRFKHFLHLSDYTAEELIRIFTEFNVKPAGFTLTNDALEEAKKVIRNMVSSKGPNFGNASEMRDLFSRIKGRQSSRLFKLSEEERRSVINTIEVEDIRGAEDKLVAMDDVLAELDAMVGMIEVKKTVRSIATLISAQKKRIDLARTEAMEKGETWEPRADQKHGNHIVITGNPGTGKTTIVRTLAKLFKAIGALPTDRIVEISGNNLKSEYQAKTAEKVGEFVRQAMGGILFIDEAYVLANERGPVDSAAKEAGDTLITHLENSRDKFICIAAGYETNMGLFLDKLNPGMRGRYNHIINIADYTADELYQIFEKSFVKKGDYVLSPAAAEAAKKAIDAMVRKKQPNFSNAREMRILYEEVIRRQGLRVMALPEDQATREVFNTIEAEDIGEAAKPVSIDDVLADLDAMVGMAEVKAAVRSMANTVALNKKILEKTGKAPEGEGNNIIITGNQGTGKTTIVHTLSKLFKAIDLLPDDRPLVITGNDLKGVVIGESKEKVNEFCRQAAGRVLFIDEAYSLVGRHHSGGVGPIDQYAAEAITQLLAHLENSRDKFIVIAAGYKKEMDDFIKFSNPGMKSRFKHYIHIPDYSADELIEIFERYNVKKAGFTLTDAAKEKARGVIRKMVAGKDSNFGNARDIRNLFEHIKGNAASRVSMLPEDQQIEVLQIIEAEDIPGGNGESKPDSKNTEGKSGGGKSGTPKPSGSAPENNPGSSAEYKPSSSEEDSISSAVNKILERKKTGG